MKILSLKFKPYLIILICLGLLLLYFTSFFIFNNDIGSNLLLQKILYTSNENTSDLELNDAIVTRLILDNLPDNTPLTNLVVHISSDSTVQLDGIIKKDSLNEFLNSKNNKPPLYFKLITKFLPDSVPLSLKLKISVDAKNARLNLTPQAITVNGIEVKGDILPTQFQISINQAINSLISKEDKKISSINISDGHIIINLI